VSDIQRNQENHTARRIRSLPFTRNRIHRPFGILQLNRDQPSKSKICIVTEIIENLAPFVPVFGSLSAEFLDALTKLFRCI
jgi:hypothetical protein